MTKTRHAAAVAVITALVLALAASAGAAIDDSSEPARIERVRYSADGTSTRVIIMLSRSVPFDVLVLPGKTARESKARIVVDFSNAQLGPNAAKPIGVEDGLLQRIRTGQFTARTARVVLDLANVTKHTVSQLDDPPRVVIDIAGRAAPAQPAAVVAKADRREQRAPDADSAPRTDAAPRAEEAPRTEKPAPRPEPASRGEDAVASRDRREPPAATRPPDATAARPAPAESVPAAPMSPANAEPPRDAAPREQVASAPAEPALHLAPPAPRVEAAPAPAPAPPPPRAVEDRDKRARTQPVIAKRIVLDPGHGGNDPGAQGIDGVVEKDVTLAIAKQLKRRLEEGLQAEVILTRSTDVTRTLAERTAFANARGADLFISIHTNADVAGRLHGIETYTLNNSNDRATIRLAKMENGPAFRTPRGNLSFILSDLVQSGKEEESNALAERLQYRMLSRLRTRYPDVRDLGVKRGPFYVLVGAYMPCVLVETSFLSHPVEGRRLASAEYQAELVEGLYLGVADFFGDARLAKTL